MALHQILAEQAASITDLKRNPMGVMQESEGVVAILNRNQPAFYCVSPELFSYMQEILEDIELGKIAQERLAHLDAVEVSLDEL